MACMDNAHKPPLVIIAGPTATGKSAAAAELAIRMNGAVISADSMQVYRGMDIGSAKVTAEEMRGVNCSTLYILDRVEHIVSEAQQKPKRTGNEVTTCKILGVLKRVMDVNLGKRPGESARAFEERKFKAFNDADELIGDTEPQCDE